VESGRIVAGALRLILFHLPNFENTKHQKVPTKMTFSKNRICRGPIALRFLQRATYVLMIHLTGKM
jgi:hypothetical protein